MDALLTAKDFPRWTRSVLGLPLEASIDEEIDRHIIWAEDHVRGIIGDAAFDALAEDGEQNAKRRTRFQSAVHALVESRLHNLHAETLGRQTGTSTQGRRTRTVTGAATSSARSASTRSYRDYVEAMFRLGYTVRPEATGVHYTRVSA